MKQTLLLSSFISILALAGCTSAQQSTPVAETGSESSVVVETRPEVDEDATSDWQAYTSEEYGFSFEYPADAEFTEHSTQEVQVNFMEGASLKVLVQSLEEASSEEVYSPNFTVYSKTGLAEYKDSIASDNNLMVYGVPAKQYLRYDQPSNEFVLATDLFIEGNLIQLFMPLPFEDIEYPTDASDAERLTWSEDIIEEYKEGELHSDGVEEFMDLYNGVLGTLGEVWNLGELYTNDEYGSMFTYPENWVLTELDDWQQTGLSTVILSDIQIEETDYLVVQYTDRSFLDFKTWYNTLDALDNNVSGISDSHETRVVNGGSVILGEHPTAIGVTQKFRFYENDSGYNFFAYYADGSASTDTYKQILDSIQMDSEALDMQTYANEEYGFSFKYPTKWGEVSSAVSSHSPDWIYIDFSNNIHNNPTEGVGTVGMQLFHDDHSITIEGESSFVASLNDESFNLEPEEFANLFTDNTVIDVDKSKSTEGRDYFILSTKLDTMVGTQFQKTAYIQLPQSDYYVMVGQGKATDIEFVGIINSIKSTDLLANWQTYTNEVYGYSIKYPVGWSPFNERGSEGSFYSYNPEGDLSEVNFIESHYLNAESAVAFVTVRVDGQGKVSLGGVDWGNPLYIETRNLMADSLTIVDDPIIRHEIKELGVAIGLPFAKNQLEVQERTCGVGEGCDQTGSTVVGSIVDGTSEQVVIQAVSDTWSPAKAASLSSVKSMVDCAGGESDACFPGTGQLIAKGDIDGHEYLVYEAIQSLENTSDSVQDFDYYLGIVELDAAGTYDAMALVLPKKDISQTRFTHAVSSIEFIETYSNQELGFEFAYPKQWQAIDTSEGINFTDPKSYGPYVVELTYTTEDFESHKEQIEDSERIASGESLLEFLTQEEITLAERKAVRGTHKTLIGPSIYYYFIYGESKNVYFESFSEEVLQNVVNSLEFSN